MTRTMWAAAVVLTLLGAGESRSDDGDARSNETRIASRWIAAWNSHDVERVLDVFTEDVVYEDVAFGVVNHGAAELRAFAAANFAAVPDFRVELVESSVKGGRGTIEWMLSGTDVGLFKTGKRFSVRGVAVIELDGHRISRNSDFFDLATVLRQVGVLPSGD